MFTSAYKTYQGDIVTSAFCDIKFVTGINTVEE